MKKLSVMCFVVLVGILLVAASLSIPGKKMQDIQYPQKIEKTGVKTSANMKLNLDFGKIPLYFIPNKGQVDAAARFYARTSRYTLWMTKEGLVFDSVHTPASGRPSQEGINKTPHLPYLPYSTHSPESLERDVSRFVFLESNQNPGIVPLEMTQHRVNYFKGNDPAKWQKGIHTSKAVLYKDVYQNIDLKVYGVESQVEYDWIVKPGANPNDIRFKYTHVSKTHIDKEGNLVVETKFGKMIHKRPISYQVIEGEKVAVQSTFKKTGKNAYGFEVESYNQDYELIIDPMVAITYSTYLGGSNYEEGRFSENGKGGIAVDCSGCIYAAGYTVSTSSTNFPTAGSCPDYSGSGSITEYDTFVTKFNSDGSGLVYSVVIGGSVDDKAYDIAVDANGCAYVTGITHSSDFPLARNSHPGGGNDAIFFCLDADGCLQNSWYIGGAGGGDEAYAIALDSSNNAYITGFTASVGFPVTAGVIQPTHAGGVLDAFVCKINCTSGIIASTFLGGSVGDMNGRDNGYGIAVDDSYVYVAGYTENSDFPTVCAYDSTYNGGRDGFVAVLNLSLTDLVYSTFLGGSGKEMCTGIALDSSGCAYVSGQTKSENFPVKCAIQDTYAGGYDMFDAFVTKLRFLTCSMEIVYSTYLGGGAADNGWRLAVDGSGAVYLTGYTNSDNFPTENPFQSQKAGMQDVYAAKIDANGTHLVYSTYLGGSSNEVICDIAIDCADNPNAYVFGGTESEDFPVHNPYQRSNAGDMDAFVTKFTFSGCDPVLWTDKDLINFSVKVGSTTGPQSFLIRNIGGGTLEWEVTENSDWIQCSPTNGTNFGVVEIQLDDLDGLEEGANTTEITVTDPNAVNSPKKVYVTIWLFTTGYPPPASGLPFGAFELPNDGIAVSGNVAFTGWALDDIGVESVKIYRKDGASLVHMGDACFPDWARPDVWQVYPDFPNSFRAGWGYLYVTNCLADGTYEFHAKAKDVEGNEVTLGTKTITILNATAVKPFGDIVTPGQCCTVSCCSSNEKIDGWAATQPPKVIIKVEVFVDLVNVGEAVLTPGGTPAPPCPDLIPVYKSFDYDLNTVGYSNGLHTLYCKATDSGGKVNDFGHRYFSIHNIGSINSISQMASSIPVFRPISEIGKIPVDSRNLFIVKGDSRNIKPRGIRPDRGGHIYIQIEEMERIEVQLNTAPGTSNYTGYHVIGNYLIPLPVGSTLDKERGIFYWLPGPGFMGSYQMVFIEEKPNREMTKKFVNVKIVPKFMKGEK